MFQIGYTLIMLTPKIMLQSSIPNRPTINLTNITVTDIVTTIAALIVPIIIWWSRKNRMDFETKVSSMIKNEVGELEKHLVESAKVLHEATTEAKHSGDMMSMRLENIEKKISHIEKYLEKNNDHYIPK